jgi:CBS domain-containing protein
VLVSELTGGDVLEIASDATLEEVADALVSAQVGVLPVRDGDKVVAVVSERDIVNAVARRLDLRTTRAIDIANRGLVWCYPTSSVNDVASEMMDRYVRHVLVEEDGELVGIVSARDLLGAYAAEDLEPD